ncbi:TRAP transporter substrate-binding protein [Marinimicrococcus flavescens]|uniref:TRAP transporter substrate-binding protein n=1 Tax=Marinimicrococcus flavescens TaxID=3031815 RepID=A0AAP3XR67_9PROT|nr:TRAP transporter substrate-binding protein [Marinimicrococcus flavescens]
MSNTTRRTALGLAGAATLAAPAVLRAQETRTWRMVTSWPRDLPGPGMNARRLAERIGQMSGGRLVVKLYSAGELVPALQVFDAVYSGTAEMAHSASLYWTGKARAAAFFTTIPFGLTPQEHIAWIEHGGGQELWDELYEPFGIKPFMAGSSGMQMGGWFRKPLQGLADLDGLKIRAVGLSADLFRRLGALPVVLGVPDIYAALQTGAVDGVEFLGPSSDRAQGFQQVASHYYWPTFTKPNGTAECLVSRGAWDGLPPDLRAVIANACAAENQFTLTESDWRNAEALEALVGGGGVQLHPWPGDIVAAARLAAEDLLAAFDAAGGIDARIHDSYVAARRRAQLWARASTRAYLEARGVA